MNARVAPPLRLRRHPRRPVRRQRGRRRPGEHLSAASCERRRVHSLFSDRTAPRASTRGATAGVLVGFGSWLGIDYSLALVLAQNAPAWFWHVQLRTRHPQRSKRRPDLRAGSGAGPLRRGASQRVLRQPVHRSHAAESSGARCRRRLAPEPGGRRAAIRGALIGSLREGSSFATDALQFHGLADRAGESARGPRRRSAGPAPAARAFDGRSCGRAAAARAEGQGRRRLFRLDRGGSPRSHSSAPISRASSEVLALPEAVPAAIDSRSRSDRHERHCRRRCSARRRCLPRAISTRQHCERCSARRGATKSAMSRAGCCRSFTARIVTSCCVRRSCACCARTDISCAPGGT